MPRHGANARVRVRSDYIERAAMPVPRAGDVMSAPNWDRFLAASGLDPEGVRALLGARAVCTHQHRIDLARAPGIRGSHFSEQVKRDWTVEDLRAATDPAGLTRRVLVQVVDPWDGDAARREANLGDVEAHALAALCREHDDCLSAVVSVDFTLPREALAARMAELGADPAVSGLRLIHTQAAAPGENPFADPRFERYCELAGANGLNVELLCREAPGHYPSVIALLEKFGGEWPVVINHAGNPGGLDGAGPSVAYREFLGALAARGNVVVKTALDEWAPHASPADVFFPYWDAMLEAGGFDWLVFETNFPVCLESADYADPAEGLRDALGRQLAWLYERGCQQHLASFMWGNAERVY